MESDQHDEGGGSPPPLPPPQPPPSEPRPLSGESGYLDPVSFTQRPPSPDIRPDPNRIHKAPAPLPTDDEATYPALPVRADSVADWKPQVWCTCVADTATLCAGLSLGFTGICFSRMTNDDVVETTQDEQLWIAGLFGIGGIVGGLLVAVTPLGRRQLLLAANVIFLLGWILATVALNSAMLYSARFFQGVGGGCQGAARIVYVSEIVQPHLKKLLIASGIIAWNLGVLIVYLMGSLMGSWRLVAGLCACLSTASLAALFFILPESPWYLLAHGEGDEDAAEHSLRKLRGRHYDPKLLRAELDRLRRSVRKIEPLFRVTAGGPSLRQWKVVSTYHRWLSGVKRHRWLKLAILMFITAVPVFTGSVLWIASAVDVFKALGTHVLDSAIATISAGGVMTVISVLSIVLVHYLPLRCLVITSAFGMFASLVTLSCVLQFGTSHTVVARSWLAIISVWSYLCFLTPGFIMSSQVLQGIVFPQRLRASFCGFLAAAHYLLVFTSAATFHATLNFHRAADVPFDTSSINVAAWIFTAFAVVAVVGSWLWVPSEADIEEKDIVALIEGFDSESEADAEEEEEEGPEAVQEEEEAVVVVVVADERHPNNESHV